MKLLKKIFLIIEDDKVIRTLTRKIIEQLGGDVFEASNASEGKMLLQGIIPHLIILDLNLPDEHGFSLLENMRANNLLDEVPIMVFSAEGHEETIIKSIQLGASEYYIKPLHSGLFIQKIRKILRNPDEEEAVELKNSEDANIITWGSLNKISTTEISFDTPIKPAVNSTLKVKSDAIKEATSDNVVCSPSSVMYSRTSKGNYTCKCKFIGLQEEIREKINHIIRGWS